MVTTARNPNITPEMVESAETLFKAMAYTETIRPIVEEYQHRIIAELKPSVQDEFKRIGFTTITESKDSYLMKDVDFQVYLKRCAEEAKKAGFIVPNDDYCPLLIAEDLKCQAEHAFIDAMLPLTHITANMALNGGLETYHKLIDLSLRLLAPYVKGVVK